jgi:molecular chaperone DnaK (HSP70)
MNNEAEQKVDVQSVVDTIRNTLSDIKKDFKPEKLTKEERQEILEMYDDLEAQAIKTKAALKMQE